ncbi:MAG: cation-translocating P-type ATPase C-terminal domain-containing protein, partial [Syntrophomonadaceae bacterium]|nr:cation-translocating P-type ATPase C-terminal domain-containing protein [Syntrophomonadaceae bacterium]
PAALNILQILAVDLGTDMVPALALGAERAEEGVMRQPPRPKHRHLLDHWLLLRAYGFLGLIEAAAAMLAFVGVWRLNGITLADLQAIHPALLAGSAPGEVAALYRQATTAALAAIVACQLGNVFACRSEQRPLPLLRAGDNRLLALGIACEVGLLLALAYVPSLQAVFQTAPLRPWQWLALLLCPLLMLAADVLWKRWRFRAPAP